MCAYFFLFYSLFVWLSRRVLYVWYSEHYTSPNYRSNRENKTDKLILLVISLCVVVFSVLFWTLIVIFLVCNRRRRRRSNYIPMDAIEMFRYACIFIDFMGKWNRKSHKYASGYLLATQKFIFSIWIQCLSLFSLIRLHRFFVIYLLLPWIMYWLTHSHTRASERACAHAQTQQEREREWFKPKSVSPSPTNWQR